MDMVGLARRFWLPDIDFVLSAGNAWRSTERGN